MPSPILARADALMHRRRQNPEEGNDFPTLTDAIDPEADVPLLIDIDEMPPAPAAATPSATAPLTAADNTVVAVPAVDVTALSEELARRVTARLQAALPGIVASVVADFLAEQADKENNAAR